MILTQPRRFPLINYLIILTTIGVFLIQISAPDFETFVYQYGFVPARFNLFDLNSYRYILYSLFSSRWLVSSFINMWFLHIFGDNVEDRLGHFKVI